MTVSSFTMRELRGREGAFPALPKDDEASSLSALTGRTAAAVVGR